MNDVQHWRNLRDYNYSAPNVGLMFMSDANISNNQAGDSVEYNWRPHQHCVPLGTSGPFETIEDVLRDAEFGSTEAQVKAASHYHAIANYQEAYRWFLEAARKGDVSAQANLAFMHQSGQGASLDGVAAAEWMKAAALQGDPTSQYILGLWLAEGRCVSRNEMLADEWFRKAADQGHTLALKRLQTSTLLSSAGSTHAEESQEKATE